MKERCCHRSLMHTLTGGKCCRKIKYCFALYAGDARVSLSEYNSCGVDHKNHCAGQTKPVLMGSRTKIGQSRGDPVSGRPSRKCGGCSASRRSVSVLTTA
jgi:hypothetical protein